MPVVNFVACLDLDQISADFEISNFSRYPYGNAVTGRQRNILRSITSILAGIVVQN